MITLLHCRVWIAMVQDDDVRVPFGKAHENAREIVENHDALKLLTACLETHQSDIKTLEYCLAAIRALTVRNEYCQEVVDEGGLTHVRSMMVTFPQEQELITRCLQVIKVMAAAVMPMLVMTI